MQSPSPEAPHAREQRSCALPWQLGGSLSCGPLSTAGHMLCTALQTTQRFINTAQIRLFTHRGEAEIARSAQPCNAPGSRILPISPAEAGKASRLLDCLGPFASRALGVRPFAPGGDRTLYHIPISTALLEHSRSGTPSTPNPTPPPRLCGISPGPQTPRPQPLTTAAAPLPAATGVTSALDSLSPASRQPHARFPAGSLQLTPVTLGFWQRHRTQAAATPLPRAASQRFPEPPVPVPTAPRHRRDGTTASAQPPPEPRAVPPAHLPPPPAAARRPRGAAAPRATRRTAAARAAGPWRHRHTGAVGRPPPF